MQAHQLPRLRGHGRGASEHGHAGPLPQRDQRRRPRGKQGKSLSSLSSLSLLTLLCSLSFFQLAFQEFFLIPSGAQSFAEALRYLSLPPSSLLSLPLSFIFTDASFFSLSPSFLAQNRRGDLRCSEERHQGRVRPGRMQRGRRGRVRPEHLLPGGGHAPPPEGH